MTHNWISTDLPPEGVKTRDLVLQFSDQPLRQASVLLPELRQVFPLFERAKHGIEFKGISVQAYDYMVQIRHCSGLQRLSKFIELLSLLTHYPHYQLLSSAQLQSFDDDASLRQISEAVDYITNHYANQFSLADIAKKLGMSESRFSRYFHRATGNTFTDFVNRLRINRACQLLMETDQYISTICYNVGFNNVANFNRRFLELKGIAPRDYRRQGAERYSQEPVKAL